MSRPLYVIQVEEFSQIKYWAGADKRFSPELRDAKVYVNLIRCNEQINNLKKWYPSSCTTYRIFEVEMKLKGEVNHD